jgi:hypothetical protein
MSIWVADQMVHGPHGTSIGRVQRALTREAPPSGSPARPPGSVGQHGDRVEATYGLKNKLITGHLAAVSIVQLRRKMCNMEYELMYKLPGVHRRTPPWMLAV